ncbi:uncharacterized protein LOC131284764 [Anopheles ziemanni]|uniref:uncharacterized protein LOC131284764 n=1 Tax=Anopheles ziemanni TaxID=345580 RepID=UPI00265EC87F|nr:uncharacterized protein LOC131284764 [Anopheles ziemanni]
MATREKKARSVTADSPTPSLGSANSGSSSNISTIAINIGNTVVTGSGGATSSGGGGGVDGGSASAPTTPTSSRKGATTATNVNSVGVSATTGNVGGSGGSTASSSSSSTTRASLSRAKSKQLLLSDEPAASNDDPVPLASPSEGSTNTVVTTPTRATRRGGSIAREDSVGPDANASSAVASATQSSKEKEDMPQSAAAGTSKDHTKSPAIGARQRAAAAAAAAAAKTSKQSVAKNPTSTTDKHRKHRVVALKRTLLKRKGKKIIGKPILGKKGVARRQLAASAAAKTSSARATVAMPTKKEVTTATSPTSSSAKEDTDLLSTPSLRNGKPRNSDSPVAKRKSVGAALKREINKSPDPLTVTPAQVKIERRRSSSMPKSEDGDAAGFEFKRELLDDEVRCKIVDKMAEAFNGRKQEVTTPGGTLRRSMRQRKSTTRDKDEFATPRLKGAGSLVDIKVEPAESTEEGEVDIGGTAQPTAPLTIDTGEEAEGLKDEEPTAASTSSSSSSGSVGTAGNVVVGEGTEPVEKDPSLSPELISEGVSELSVKECYSEPAFLENNLGIEKDPKLGEIVQGRFRCDKVSDASGGACEEDEEEAVVEEEEEEEEDKEEEVHVQESVAAVEDEEVKDDGNEAEVPVVVADSTMEASDRIVGETVESVEGDKEQKEDDEKMIVDEDQQPLPAVAKDENDEDVTPPEIEMVEITENRDEDDAMEEEDVEVVVELDSGKADSDSETVASERVEESVAKEADKNENEADVEMNEEPTVEVVEEVVNEVSKDATEDKVMEVVVEEAVEIGDKEKSPPAEQTLGDEKSKTASEDVAEVATVPTEADKSGTASPARLERPISKTPTESNGTTVASVGESEQSNGNNQQTPRTQKVAASATTTTPKAKSTAGGGTAVPTPTGSGSGKETKSKSRATKEKTKDDEKTREEKLRQEKLRVEEKVREEKLRAEMRLKEELLHQKDGIPIVVLENGTADEVPSAIGGRSPASSRAEGKDSPNPAGDKAIGGGVEKEQKTDPAVTALIALPAITILKKETGTSNVAAGTPKRKLSKDAAETGTGLVGQKLQAELEILPIPAEPTGKEEKQQSVKEPTVVPTSSVDSVESPLQIISKSEQAAAAVTITVAKAVEGVADGNKSPLPPATSSSSSAALTITKIEDERGSATPSPNGSGDEKKLKRTAAAVAAGSTLVAQLPADKASIVVVTGKEEVAPPALRLLEESDDVAKQKESHLKNLGLLTIRAACEEKQRRAEQKPSAPDGLSGDGTTSAGGGEGWLAGAIGSGQPGSAGSNGSGTGASGGRNGSNKSARGSRDEYTVSMKTTVLCGKGGAGGSGRGEKRKQQRMPLKMTFQKGKGKGASAGAAGGGSVAVRDSSNGSGTSSNGSAAAGYGTDGGSNGDTFYTIHNNELDQHSSNSSDGHSHRDSSTGGRKAHSRSHTTDGVNLSDSVGESSAVDKAIQKSLVIPEKASSFNVHPERLCQDQCFYCGGKFGLYDTPCHIAAIKSTERQQKILLAESKITLDSCLCDACFRHVDRKANYPSQKKKTASSGPQQQQNSASTGSSSTSASGGNTSQSTVSPIVIKMTTNKDGSTSITGQQQNHHHQPMVIDDGSGVPGAGNAREICAVRQCTAHAMQSLRRKWVLKMKRKIGKQLDINLEQAARATTENISICNRHYEQISHLMICAMCTKPLQRNHVYHMYNNIPQLERLLQQQGIDIRLSSSELVVCKLCRHYANLMFKPPDPKSQKAQFIKNYKRRLCTARQRDVNELSELPLEVEVQSVDSLDGLTSDGVAPALSTVDIVISDGEDDDVEDDEVEEYRDPLQQQQQPLSQQKLAKVSELFSMGENSVSLRRRGSSRKSPDVSIIENSGSSSSSSSMAQMSDRLGEITIIPTTKTYAASAQHQNQQQSRDDNFDMTRALKSNPNISMRELFPGEEELGIHVNIPFSSSTARTPEGWTKVTSTIQYDDNTRALWDELQKPYGNQSSFLRHLILLEKYFRNGDLILSPQAKTSATTYSEAVQSRLRSFDNVPTLSSPPALASLTPANVTHQDKTSNIFQQFSSATITIVPASKARARVPSSSATNAGTGNSNNSSDGASLSTVGPVSLLKSNNLRPSGSSDKASANSLKRKLSNEGKPVAATAVAIPPNFGTSGGGIVSKVAKLDEPKAASSAPPELISINRKSNIPVTTVPTASLVASTSGAVPPPPPLKQQSLLQQPTAMQQQSQAKRSPPSYAASTSTNAGSQQEQQREIIQMPEHLTESEREEATAKPWRPTLLPIAPGAVESLKYGPLYQTADGRLLPMLVQVMSGGKPYHISIDDYNRMCILRREKLLQQQHNNNNTQSTTAAMATAATAATISTMATKRALQAPGIRPSGTSGTTATGGTSSAVSLLPPALRLSVPSVENSPIGTGVTTITPATTSTRLVQLPNQILEQNSLIPIAGSSRLGSAGSAQQKQHSSSSGSNSSLTVTMTTAINSNNLSKSATSSSSSNAVKPLTLPNSTTVYPMVISANTISLPSASTASSSTSSSSALASIGSAGGPLGMMFSQASSIGRSNASATSLVLTQQHPTTAPSLTNNTVNLSVNSSSSNSSSGNNPLDLLLKGGSHVTQSQLQAFAAAAANGNATVTGTLLDNSPAQLLSKIPKSLTVIPQQKQRSMSRVSSHEDQHSA